MSMDPWLKWHSGLCNLKLQFTDGYKYGTDFEAQEMHLPKVE